MMLPISDVGLEKQLTAAGKALYRPPSSLGKLLRLLDRAEKLLSKVEQSPTKSMLAALSPLMDALMAKEFLKHSDVDVKVGAACCISEIIRITAPETPYDDDKMKEVFSLIVSAFENFTDTASRSYNKRASILEMMAKVRYCVIMLDLECYQMIIEMFQHLLGAVRVHHSEIISESIVAVMTLILEESEEMASMLVAPIMAAIKENEDDTLQNAKKMAEKVLENCGKKISPYLTQASETLASSSGFLDDHKHTERVKALEFREAVNPEENRVLLMRPKMMEGVRTRWAVIWLDSIDWAAEQRLGRNLKGLGDGILRGEIAQDPKALSVVDWRREVAGDIFWMSICKRGINKKGWNSDVKESID